MEEVKFTSSLSEEQILDNFKDIDFFSGIMSGLEEALAYEKEHAKASGSLQTAVQHLDSPQNVY
ncbi:MAG: hypothetical protein PUC06_04055 [Oscillospiraceae bacterium]|nr:hypothetical protein [Oscillospiraceae bacterium]